ncbi:hypothetical protein B0H16DRAFT_1749447 [Mycena metata]|uniref:ATP-dependent DNA helicase n=1 Tax=Mycena metata TaxID=1033252 RepID=A0AAD7GKK5_9AGAR|nr:hypothetical protein B0H16DRAFT_1749447 [Mycena metata]
MQKLSRENNLPTPGTTHPKLGVQDDLSADMDHTLYGLTGEVEDASDDEDDYVVRLVEEVYVVDHCQGQTPASTMQWDEVKVLGHEYLYAAPHGTKSMAEDMQNSIVSDFELNEEQERAFRLLAEHASSPQPVPLRMYMGGMGGTGKSRVVKAIVEYFARRGEAYRFVVLGPTGSVAAMLSGSTYHSVFKIPRDTKSKNSDDVDGLNSEATSLANVNERLHGVEQLKHETFTMFHLED